VRGAEYLPEGRKKFFSVTVIGKKLPTSASGFWRSGRLRGLTKQNGRFVIRGAFNDKCEKTDLQTAHSVQKKFKRVGKGGDQGTDGRMSGEGKTIC